MIRVHNVGDWLCNSALTGLRNITEFGMLAECSSKNELVRYRKSLDEESKCLVSEEERLDFLDFHIEDLQRIEDDYPQLSRQFCIVKVAYITEYELIRAAEFLHRKFPIEPYRTYCCRKRRRVGLESAASYIDNETNVHFPRGRVWESITIVKMLRNAIAHRDGVLTETEIKRVRESEFNTDLCFETYGNMRIMDTILTKLAVPASTMFNALYESIYISIQV